MMEFVCKDKSALGSSVLHQVIGNVAHTSGTGDICSIDVSHFAKSSGIPFHPKTWDFIPKHF